MNPTTAPRDDHPGSTDTRADAASHQRLSVLDAAFLYFDRPNQRLAVGCVAEVDGPLDAGALRALIAERLCSIPRYRERPVRATLDLDRPTWEPDPDFDVARHVHHVGLPAPGGATELHDLVDDLFAAPLDPDRPLWEVHLISGVRGDRCAILCKTHHCMIDGVSGAQLLTLLTDPAAGSAGKRGAFPPPSRPTASPASPLAMLRSLGDALRPAAALQLARDLGHAVETLAGMVFEPATPLPFNGPLSGRRRIVWSEVSLDDVMAVRAAAGCKVNDVVLTIVAGALHHYLEAAGFPTSSARVRAAVPVSVRTDGDRLALGNLITLMLPTLPIGPAAPQERLRRIAEETMRLKESGQARAAGLLLALAGALPTPVEAAIGRYAPDWPVVNTICTNVPGPADERAILGRRIAAVHPIVPLFQSMGLEFAVMSYGRRLSIAAVADHRLVDAEAVRDAIARSAAEILAAHREASPAPPSRREPPTVGDLMTRAVVTIGPLESLLAAHRRMRERGIRHLPVVDRERRLLGILTQRDVLAAHPSSVAEDGGRALDVLARTTVAEVMETHVSVALEAEPGAEAGLRMARRKIGCLPVTSRDGALVGIVTTADFLLWAAAAMGRDTSERAA